MCKDKILSSFKFQIKTRKSDENMKNLIQRWLKVHIKPSSNKRTSTMINILNKNMKQMCMRWYGTAAKFSAQFNKSIWIAAAYVVMRTDSATFPFDI